MGLIRVERGRDGREPHLAVLVLEVRFLLTASGRKLMTSPRRFIKEAPVMREAKKEYWTDQIQPFFDSFAERDLSTTQERSEVTKRHVSSQCETLDFHTH